jgi:hypothetical protein
MADKGKGYLADEVVGCQFSVYPLRQMDIDTAVQGVIKAASEHCSVRVSNLSTLMWGDEEQVFAGLRAVYKAAQTYGPTVVISTLVAGMPGDELVGEIQADVEADVAASGQAEGDSDRGRR